MTTKEQKLSTAAALVAEANDKPWQLWIDGWVNPNTHESILDCISVGYILRPAPEPEPPKPWDCMDDVPPICWVRLKQSSGIVPHWLIMTICENGVYPHFGGECELIHWSALTKYEYSTTRRADDWHPCAKAPK